LVDPSDPAAASAAAAKQPPTPSKPATTTAPESGVAEETKPVVEETPVSHPATPLKPFNTESLAQRLRPVTSTDLPDAPSITRANNSSAASLPGIVPNQPAPPPPPKATPTAVPSAPVAASASAPSGGQLMPAVVITRVDAEYPKMARQAGASGLVEIEATIGLDGKVKNPHVLKGNSMLQKSAIDAVLQWRYKPATLNGKPVESPVDIKLNFVPSH
jgi:protein TonB